MTLEFPTGSIDRKEGHVYTQFYSEVKAPFDAAKMYPFENTGYESLAMDPAFVEIIAYAGGAVVFNAKTCEQGYLNTKNRANRNTMDALSLRPLQLGFLARKFLGTYKASPKYASIIFFDLRGAANIAIEF
jgi:hypothetical protein